MCFYSLFPSLPFPNPLNRFVWGPLAQQENGRRCAVFSTDFFATSVHEKVRSPPRPPHRKKYLAVFLYTTVCAYFFCLAYFFLSTTNKFERI